MLQVLLEEELAALKAERMELRQARLSAILGAFSTLVQSSTPSSERAVAARKLSQDDLKLLVKAKKKEEAQEKEAKDKAEAAAGQEEKNRNRG
eukprot:s6528_g1.t1